MPTKTSTVRVADIPAIVADPKRGIVSLVGDHGGHALITGDITLSSLMMGMIAIETEHGTVFLEPEAEVEISEEYPRDDQHEWLVTWSIDGNGSTPEQAAARVWRDIFGRTMAGDDDACVFFVKDSESNEVTTVDLSEFDFESLSD